MEKGNFQKISNSIGGSKSLPGLSVRPQSPTSCASVKIEGGTPWQRIKVVFQEALAAIGKFYRGVKLTYSTIVFEQRMTSLAKSYLGRSIQIRTLRRRAREESNDLNRMQLLHQVKKIYRILYADQVLLNWERLRIMREKLALQASDPTDEQLSAVAEQQREINRLLLQHTTVSARSVSDFISAPPITVDPAYRLTDPAMQALQRN